MRLGHHGTRLGHPGGRNEEGSETRWALAARPFGPRRVAVRAVSSEGDVWRADRQFDESLSPAEVTLLGLALGLGALNHRGVTEVRVLVRHPTLEGYLRRSWRPKSPRMVSALRSLVDSANGMNVTFIDRRV